MGEEKNRKLRFTLNGEATLCEDEDTYRVRFTIQMTTNEGFSGPEMAEVMRMVAAELATTIAARAARGEGCVPKPPPA